MTPLTLNIEEYNIVPFTVNICRNSGYKITIFYLLPIYELHALNNDNNLILIQ